MALLNQLEKMFTPVVEGLGCVLWGVELISHERSATLRIFIDKLTGPTIDDCERVSRQVSALMDVEDPIETHYRLEVSTPGLDRQFFAFEQLRAYIGQEIKVKTHSRGAGRKRNFIGFLLSMTDQDFSIRETETDQTLTFSWSDVDKSSLVFRFNDE